jgi:hypothetical protein
LKPRNKHERDVVDALKELKSIPQKVQQYFYKKSFTPQGVISRKTLSCFECGHSEKIIDPSQYIDKKHKCSNCKKTISVSLYSPGTYKAYAYNAVITTVKNYQVVRIFFVSKISCRQSPSMFSANEVIQHVLDAKGRITILSKNISQSSYYCDIWNTSSELSIKNPYGYARNPDILNIYPTIKVIPELKRNGFDNNFYDLTPISLFHRILAYPWAETLLKTKQIDVLKNFSELKLDLGLTDVWKSVNICIRNNYLIEDACDWNDYRKQLIKLNKDTLNPKYICPKDLKKEHNKCVEKIQRIQKKQRLQELQQEIDKNNKLYQERISKFLNFNITNEEIVIRVIPSVLEIKNIGEDLKHCIFVNEYYKKDTILLTAEINKKPVETIEVDLKNLEIVQARGYENLPSKYNQIIVNMVNDNIIKLKKLSKSKKKVNLQQ